MTIEYRTYKEICEKLWAIIDDIDTYDDMAKSNDKVFRDLVYKAQKKRWQYGSTDGYNVTFYTKENENENE